MNNKYLLSLGAAMLLLNAVPAAAKTDKTKGDLKQIKAGMTSAQIAAIARAHTAELIERQQETGSLKTAKTTASASRLIATARRESDGTTLTLTDSSRYKYSWGRGGDLKTTLKFDTSYDYSNGGGAGILALIGRSLGIYDKQNNQLSLNEQLYNTGTAAYRDTSRTLNTYNAANLLVETETQNWTGGSWDPASRDRFTYNVAEKPLTDTNFTWNGSTWDYQLLISTSYTASSKENKQRVFLYFSGIWLEVAAISYTYDASDLLVSSLTQVNTSGMGLENYERASYTYDAAKNPIVEETESWDGSVWVKANKKASTFDAAANVLSEIQLDWNDTTSSYDSSTRTNYTYNTYNQTTSETTYTFDGSTWVMNAGDTRTNYYYQDYSTTTIKENNLAATNVEIYPVPANSQLHIRVTATDPIQMNIRISDLQGRSIINKSYPAAQQITDVINTAEFPSGQYFLQTNNGSVRTFTVVH